MYYDEFDPFHDDNEREVYQDDLQEFSDREAWDDMREEFDTDFDEFEEPEDVYLDGSYEDRYYAPETDFDWH